VSDALYERYKEALRRGHVAALRDRLDLAVEAYREAATIAPERPLPHVSLGSVLVRLRRPEEALAEYSTALAIAPRDDGAQSGRAEALAALGRAVEAADALDRLAEQQEAEGKTSDALNTTRRALELAESRPRRRQVEALTARITGVIGGAADAPVKPSAPKPVPAATQPVPAARPEPQPASRPQAPARTQPPPEPATRPPAAPSAPQPGTQPAPEPQPSGATLSAQAEDRIDAGDPETARDRLLAAAASHRAAGAIDAALDACYQALALAPADPELHLALAELYLDRGWRGPAADKILLLGRLVDFTRDGTIRERVCTLVASRIPDDPRLSALCA
jgi:tetratricopeptide (TPR) repeat protein